jgi:methyl-accepting chemotaxis protein
MATREISRNIHDARNNTEMVATDITQVNTGATETGTASSQVLSSAQSLSAESNRLKLRFMDTVRAA